MLTGRKGHKVATLALAGALASVVSGLAAPAQAADVCGSYTYNGSRYWGSCVSHGQEIRWHVAFPIDFFNYACVAPGESMYIGPSATIWGVFATGDHC